MVFKLFVSEVRSLSEVAVRRSNEFLSPLNLSLSIDWEYDSWEDIYDGNAIGVYEADSVFGGEIVIGFNLRNLYKAFNRMVKDYPFSDSYTMLDEMIETNVYHEMGHGIVQLFNDYLQESDDLDELYDNNREVFDCVLDNEEDAVEKFAWSFYDNQLDESELYQIIRLYLDSYNIKTEGIDMNKKGKTIIRLTEGDLHRIVKESVKRILSEEVDMGQVPSVSDRQPRSLDSKEEAISKQIRHLRKLIDEYESEGKDIKPLQDKIKHLKKQAGY